MAEKKDVLNGIYSAAMVGISAWHIIQKSDALAKAEGSPDGPKNDSDISLALSATALATTAYVGYRLSTELGPRATVTLAGGALVASAVHSFVIDHRMDALDAPSVEPDLPAPEAA